MDFIAGPKANNATTTDPLCRNYNKHIMSKYLGDKNEEWAAVSRKSPLNLLDLPVDILKEIVREVSYTSWLLGDCSRSLSGDPHQRFNLPCSHSLGSSCSCHPSDLFTIRHCLAGWSYHDRKSYRSRRLDVWPGNSGHGERRLRRSSKSEVLPSSHSPVHSLRAS
jgi:hypothetical protein